MAPMARQAASAATPTLGPSHLTQAMPTRPEMTLPPTTDHGCASGLAGRQNSSTAEAPMGAIR